MAPPMQVAAPPKGSISVGWLWVSFLNRNSQSCIFAVHVALDLHGAGVDLFGFIQILQDALGLQIFGTDGGKVHQAQGLFLPMQGSAQAQVAVECLLNQIVADLHVLQDGAEGGVTAVVAPVGVDHLDLCDGGVAMLALEVLLAELDVAQVHGQTVGLNELGQTGLVQLAEAVQRGNLGGDGVLHSQSGLLVQAGFTGFHRVDDVLFYALPDAQG